MINFWLAVMALVLAPVTSALAYVGPGAGLSAIGSLVALVVAILVAVIGFVWYPVKRLLKRNQEPGIELEETPEASVETIENSVSSEVDQSKDKQ